MRRSIDVVVNPAAGAGRAARVLGEVARELALAGFDVNVHATERTGHAAQIVRGLARQQVAIIAVMGGDGTFHEAIGGLFDEDGRKLETPSTSFALVPAGTGGDLRKTLGVPSLPREIARFLAEAKPRAFDLGELSFVTHDGRPGFAHFGNIASFGIGGLVDLIVNRGPKWLGGRASYLLGSLRATLAYKNAAVRVTVDGEPFYEGPALNVAVANGRYFGGGMFVAPNADPHDGLFDVVAFTDMNPFESTALTPYLYSGTHLGRPKVLHRRGRVVRAEKIGTRDALLDVDGEALGRIDATFRVLPGAITMLERP